jgi:pantothenate synthetase|tara:strand:- start:808 stop:927 length:120 start_codon:yes stop_codon:yes gene_type:complete
MHTIDRISQLQLIDWALEEAALVVASIFVNPLYFVIGLY